MKSTSTAGSTPATQSSWHFAIESKINQVSGSGTHDQQKDSGTVYNVFYSEFSDEGGKKYNIKSAFSGTAHSGIQEGSIIFPKENYSGNITLSLEDYPERIVEDVSIKIR